MQDNVSYFLDDTPTASAVLVTLLIISMSCDLRVGVGADNVCC